MWKYWLAELKTETMTAENVPAAFWKWHGDLICSRVHAAAVFRCIHAARQTLNTNVFSEKTIRLVSGKPQRVRLSVNALFQEVKVLPEQQHNDGFMRQVFIGSTEQAETLCDLQRPASRGDIMVKFTAWHGLDLLWVRLHFCKRPDKGCTGAPCLRWYLAVLCTWRANIFCLNN